MKKTLVILADRRFSGPLQGNGDAWDGAGPRCSRRRYGSNRTSIGTEPDPMRLQSQ